MKDKYCQIVLVGHSPLKLILSIDKEINHKIIFITEREKLPGTKEAKKALNDLILYYEKRKVIVEHIEFDFHIQTKPIAQLIYLIYQQKLLGFNEIIVNVSGGLRYMTIWFYIASSITNSKVIHADFIYEDKVEVGIISNMNLVKMPFSEITNKQFEFLGLFFREFNSLNDFFALDEHYNENILLTNIIEYKSLEDLREALEIKRNEKLSRGSINGYIQKLNNLSALNLYTNPNDKKEKMISISFLGISYFLQKAYSNINQRKL